jgi:hypothetical protein
MGDTHHVPNSISTFHGSESTYTWHTTHVSTSPLGDVIITHHFGSFPTIYGVDLLQTSKIWVLAFLLPLHSVSLTSQSPKFFQVTLSALSLDLTVLNFFPLLPNRSYDSNILSVELSLSLVKYHTDCGFILPLLLLSFVTWPTNPLVLRNILRFKIGSSEQHFLSKPWVQRPLI